MTHSISFVSGGVDCDAWHYEAADDHLATAAGRPVVVMAHGMGGTKDSGLDGFARGLAAAGLDVLAFDYRGFGASSGSPRQRFSSTGQIDDYRAAIAAAQRLAGVDRNRVVLWGVSMSGGHVLQVADGRDDIAAVIALTPFVNGLAATKVAPRQGAGALAPTVSALIRDRAGREGGLLPLVAAPGGLGMLTAPGALESWEALAGPTWRNEMGASAVFDVLRYNPARAASRLKLPTLFQIGDHDRLVPPAEAMKTAIAARATVRHYPCDHFDVYPGAPWHHAVLEDQVRFLSQTLALRSVVEK